MCPSEPEPTNLVTQKCLACEGGVEALTTDAIAEFLVQVPGWELVGKELRRTFRFRNHYESIAFVNATAWISHTQDHHPDIELGYNKVVMRYSTHAVGGVTSNDFICAAKINALLAL